jgi:plastocyanin
MNADTAGGPRKRAAKFFGVIGIIILLILLPSYLLLTSQQQSQTASGVMTLSPTVPLIAPGQTQNYTMLTLAEPSSETRVSTRLTTSSPAGLSFDVANSTIPALATFNVPIVIHASPSITPGTYQVSIKETEGSAVKSESFTVKVVAALVVMEHLAFVPEYVNVTAGTTVYWMNLDSQIGCCDPGFHDVDFSALGVESPTLARLGTYSYTFQNSGEFYYICSIHTFMTGEVRVSS